MTDFRQDKAIYRQMSDRLCDDILSGRYNAGDRIPSVRELSNARDIIMENRRKEFMEEKLPDLFRQMKLLGISIETIDRLWKG